MSTQSDLAELYTTFFNRAPDAAGLAYWVDKIDTGSLTLAQISQNWITQQPEGLSNFPSTLTDAQFVAQIYTNILGRTADTAGAQYWQNQLASGAVSRDTFAVSVINGAKANTSAQGVLDSTLITNKATVGVAYADRGINDTTLAAKVLTTVTTDASTLASTLSVISLIPNTAAAQTPAVLASANQLLTNYAALIAAAPGELADAATYLNALVSGATSTTNIATLLDNANTLLTSAATNSAALDNPAAQGAAAVAAATPSGGGGGTPSVNVLAATNAADNFTLTSGADRFDTKFGGLGTAEKQVITLTGALEVNDAYSVVLADGITTVSSGALTAATLADLVSKLEAQNTAGVTFSAGSGTDAGKLVITYDAVGNQTGTAAITQTSNAGAAVVAAVAEKQVITLNGTLNVNDAYSILLADGTTTVASGALTAGTVADLVSKLEAQNTAGVTFSAGSGADAGKLVITYDTPGNQSGTALLTQTANAGVAVSAGTFEKQAIGITGTIQTGDAYSIVLADGTPVSSGALTAPTLADLVSKLEGQNTAGVTFSEGSGTDANKLVITYDAVGDQSGSAALTQTANAGSAISAGTPEIQTVTLTGTLEVGDVFNVLLADGTTNVSSGALTAATPSDLAAKLQATNTPGVTFSEGTGADAGKLIITYTAVGDQPNTVQLTQTTDAGGNTPVTGTAAVVDGTPAVPVDVTGTTDVTNGTPAVPADVTATTVATDGVTGVAADVTGTTVATDGSAAGNSFSSLTNLDTLTGFTVGVDKVDLFSFTNLAVAAPISLTHVADITTGTNLTTDLTTAFGAFGANSAGLVTIAGGADAGTYLFANDSTAGFDGNLDVVIKLSGVTLPPQSTNTPLTVSDYFA